MIQCDRQLLLACIEKFAAAALNSDSRSLASQCTCTTYAAFSACRIALKTLRVAGERTNALPLQLCGPGDELRPHWGAIVGGELSNYDLLSADSRSLTCQCTCPKYAAFSAYTTAIETPRVGGERADALPLQLCGPGDELRPHCGTTVRGELSNYDVLWYTPLRILFSFLRLVHPDADPFFLPTMEMVLSVRVLCLQILSHFFICFLFLTPYFFGLQILLQYDLDTISVRFQYDLGL